MQYTVDEINNNVAKILFSDGSWTFIELKADMTEADFDDLVNTAVPNHLKTGGGVPSFLTEGAIRTASAKPPEVDARPQWLIDREAAYGTMESQIEYITENGLTAWQAHVAQIKADNPKPADD